MKAQNINITINSTIKKDGQNYKIVFEKTPTVKNITELQKKPYKLSSDVNDTFIIRYTYSFLGILEAVVGEAYPDQGAISIGKGLKVTGTDFLLNYLNKTDPGEGKKFGDKVKKHSNKKNFPFTKVKEYNEKLSAEEKIDYDNWLKAYKEHVKVTGMAEFKKKYSKQLAKLSIDVNSITDTKIPSEVLKKMYNIADNRGKLLDNNVINNCFGLKIFNDSFVNAVNIRMRKKGVHIQHLPYSIKMMLYMQTYQGGYLWLSESTSRLTGSTRSGRKVKFNDKEFDVIDIKIDSPLKNLKNISDAFKNKKPIEEINYLVKKFWSDYTKLYMYYGYCQYKLGGEGDHEGPGARKFMFCNFVINWQKFESEYRITPDSKIFNVYNAVKRPPWFFTPYSHKRSDDYSELEVYLHPMSYWDSESKKYIKAS